MKKLVASLSILFLVYSGAFAGELKSQLLGKWQYISITTKDGQLPIHDGDYVEFRDDEVRWRWMSKDHRHLYAVERMGNYDGIIGYQVPAPAELTFLEYSL